MSVYFAAIPLTRIVRFAPTFRPENTKGGDAVVQSIMQQWQAGEFSKMWVYPRGDQFVVADDYFTLAAAERGQPDLVPCWVLGTIQNKSAEQVQGPIDQGAVAKILGMK